MKAKLILITLPLLIVGCSTTSSPSYSPHGGSERGIPIHGNFCGQNIPTVNITTPTATINELLAIPAIDVIDEACKKHDICYVNNEKKKCDHELVNNIKNSNYNHRCTSLANQIWQAFHVKTFGHTGEILRKNDPTTGDVISIIPRLYTDAAALAFNAISLPYMYTALPVVNSIGAIAGNEKEFVFPDRYYKC